MKSNKILQNVKFDSSNGKMYEELGNTSSLSTTDAAVTTLAVTAAAAAAAASASAVTQAASDYYQSYQSYPYGQQYMSGFTYGSGRVPQG